MRADGDYISREAICLTDFEIAMCKGDYKELCKMILDKIANAPAADVRPVVVCANCEHNNHCLTQEFVDDCGKIPLDRNTFFCADGERRSNA